uniref:Uncharacterized protein n=1 Tax=Schistocephalus solidus TaxID=70667 RepID=A0A0X3NY34_SCHSO
MLSSLVVGIECVNIPYFVDFFRGILHPCSALPRKPLPLFFAKDNWACLQSSPTGLRPPSPCAHLSTILLLTDKNISAQVHLRCCSWVRSGKHATPYLPVCFPNGDLHIEKRCQVAHEKSVDSTDLLLTHA